VNKNEVVQDDEISLFDLWQRLQVGWRYLAGWTTLGVLEGGFGDSVDFAKE